MIRPADGQDVPQLVEWMHELIEHVQLASQDPYIANPEQGYTENFEHWFNKAVTSDIAAVYIAEHDNTPVGFILGTITTPFFKASHIKRIGQIELCWINPLHRRRNYARSLTAKLEAWFKKQGVTYVDLQYLSGNLEAETAWQALGYRPYRICSRKNLTP